jgi:hypothetical protein
MLPTKTGSTHLRHRVDMKTGMYNGKKVLDVVAKVAKKQKQNNYFLFISSFYYICHIVTYHVHFACRHSLFGISTGIRSEHISTLFWTMLFVNLVRVLTMQHLSRKPFHGVVSKRVILDEIIQKAAPEWPIEKIGVC